jgi:hypothetical protein
MKWDLFDVPALDVNLNENFFEHIEISRAQIEGRD